MALGSAEEFLARCRGPAKEKRHCPTPTVCVPPVDKTIYEPIEGFENYGIAKTGEIMSYKRGALLKPSVDSKGYWYVILTNAEGKQKNVRVHVLCAKHYVPNPMNLPVVDHKDCNKLSPHYENLEWVTHSENTKRAYQTKVAKAVNGVVVLKLDPITDEVIEEYPTMASAIASVTTNRSTGRVRESCLKGVVSYGFKWRYKNDNIAKFDNQNR